MGLENLKSVFKEGFPGPVDGWPNTHAEGFTLNLDEGSRTQFKIPFVYPVLDTLSKQPPYVYPVLDTLSKQPPYEKPVLDTLSKQPPFEKPVLDTPSISTPPSSDEPLDTLLRQPPSFVSYDLSTKFYASQIFDPRIPKNEGIEINQNNGYLGTRFEPPGIITDYQSAGMGNGVFIPMSQTANASIGTGTYPNSSTNDLGQLGLDLRSSEGWWSLYKNDHTPRPDDFVWLGRWTSYHYGSNVNREQLNIRNPRNSGLFSGLGKNWRNAGFGLADSEPYIVSKIPDDVLSGGRFQNAGSREIPIFRALTDTARIGKFLSSPAGLSFILKQNIDSIIPSSVVRGDILSLTGGIDYSGDDLVKVPQRFNNSYNPLSTLAAISPLARNLGIGTPNLLLRKDDLFTHVGISRILGVTREYGEIGNSFTEASRIPFDMNESFVGSHLAKLKNNPVQFAATMGYGRELSGGTFMSSPTLGKFGKLTEKTAILNRKVRKSFGSGDKMTLAPMIQGSMYGTTAHQTFIQDTETGKPSTDLLSSIGFNVEAEKHGMPFYFKDLRTNQYIFFRAYISGITENISPSWAPTNYIGRSEPVYVYERGERDISFILKLFAHTKYELQSIYKKINNLTSLCYPQYAVDGGLGQNRMKPPLTKLRMGELYGDVNSELLGFIKSLTYTVPDESPWEIRAGARVPKYITAAISYQVIHEESRKIEPGYSPGYGTQFTGYDGGWTPDQSKLGREVRKLNTSFDETLKNVTRD